MSESNNFALVAEVAPAEETLRMWASDHADSIYVPGDLGYCDPDEASWSIDRTFSVEHLMHLMGDVGSWKEWFEAEVEMAEKEGLARDWSSMLEEDIAEEIFLILRGGKGYIWDGWHRAAAVIASGRTHIPAIVGRPTAG